MKGLLILLLLGGAGFVGYKYLYKGGSTSTKASPKFIERCRQLSTTITKVNAYCDCLAKNGVRSMISLATHPASRSAVQTCQAQVGHVAPPPVGDPTIGRGGGGGGGTHPAPTGRGRNADHLSNQLRDAYKRRKVPK